MLLDNPAVVGADDQPLQQRCHTMNTRHHDMGGVVGLGPVDHLVRVAELTEPGVAGPRVSEHDQIRLDHILHGLVSIPLDRAGNNPGRFMYCLVLSTPPDISRHRPGPIGAGRAIHR